MCSHSLNELFCPQGYSDNPYDQLEFANKADLDCINIDDWHCKLSIFLRLNFNEERSSWAVSGVSFNYIIPIQNHF